MIAACLLAACSAPNTPTRAASGGTVTCAEVHALFKSQDYVAQQLPMLRLPNGPFQRTMDKSNLKELPTADRWTINRALGRAVNHPSLNGGACSEAIRCESFPDWVRLTRPRHH